MNCKIPNEINMYLHSLYIHKNKYPHLYNYSNINYNLFDIIIMKYFLDKQFRNKPVIGQIMDYWRERDLDYYEYKIQKDSNTIFLLRIINPEFKSNKFIENDKLIICPSEITAFINLSYIFNFKYVLKELKKQRLLKDMLKITNLIICNKTNTSTKIYI